MFSHKPIIVDLRGHLLGRAAAMVAKELLSGQRIVCVRAELCEISGSLFRNKMDMVAFMHKKCNYNKSHGQVHHRSPAKLFWRTVRGMIPYKTARGVAALRRLKVFNGIPHPYDTKKRMVLPSALRVMKIAPHRKVTVLGDLAEQIGWTRRAIVERFEAQRKAKSATYFNRKKQIALLRQKEAAKVMAAADPNLDKWKAILKQYGY